MPSFVEMFLKADIAKTFYLPMAFSIIAAAAATAQYVSFTAGREHHLFNVHLIEY
jgi:hypothetical protein